MLAGAVLLATTTNRMVMALSAEDGSTYWEHRKAGPFSVPPVVDGELMVAATSDRRGRIYGLRVATGRERWSKRIPGVAVPLHMEDGRIYAATLEGEVLALRTSDGDRVWSSRLGAPPASPPLPWDGALLVATIRDTLYALDIGSGIVREKRALEGSVAGPPAVRDGVVYLPLYPDGLAAVRVDGLEPLWTVRTRGPVLAAPVAARDGTVYALDRTGAVWSVTRDGSARLLLVLGSAATGSLVLAGNALLAGTLDGRLVAADAASGEELWSVWLEDSVTSPVVVRDGHVFVPLRRGTVVKLR